MISFFVYSALQHQKISDRRLKMNQDNENTTLPLSLRNKQNNLSLEANKLQDYLHEATAVNTRRAYQAGIRQFEAYGGLLPADEESIIRYLTHHASLLNPRTLSLHLTALSHWHRYQQLTDPTQTPRIRKLLKGIQRKHGKPKRKAKALRAEHINRMITELHKKNDLKAIRDSALIQIAYFGAFRRSELIAIHLEHLRFEPEGLLILIPKSKTDQMKEGKIKALPYGKTSHAACPVKAIKLWIEYSGITEGVLFRKINRWGNLSHSALHPDSISSILKSLAKQCQFDFVENVSSHSLRRGFATSAARAGADFSAIKRQGGWKNDSMVREYIEEGQLFDENAAQHLIEFYFDQKE